MRLSKGCNGARCKHKVGIPKGNYGRCFLSVVFIQTHWSFNFALPLGFCTLFTSYSLNLTCFLNYFETLLYLGSNFTLYFALGGRASHLLYQCTSLAPQTKTTQLCT